jgi:predicted transport protein
LNKQTRIYDSYDFFKEKIKEENLSPSEIYEAIKNLRIVKIDIDKDDNPHVIFERLNSTGKDLKASDLIRNYFLMKADKEGEKDGYDIWAQIEELFISKDKGASMDDFFLYYLTIKNGKSPRKKDVYKEFQDYAKSQDCMFLCEDIRCFAECYYDICFPADENPLKSVYERMKMIDVDSFYPFLLNVYYDYEKNKITEEIVEEITSICISYALRSRICESNTRTFGDTFNEIMRKTKDIPPKLQKYILIELEERGFDDKNKEIGSLDKMTIEHIIPKALTPEWKSDLGENWEDIHKKHLNVIGNLTLTGNNPNMKNYSFAQKLKIGFENSPLQLNKYIADQTKWTQEQVKERCSILAEKAKEIWSYPKPKSREKQSTIERKQLEQELTLESYEWNVRSKELFENVDAKILNLSVGNIIKQYKQQYIAYEVNDAGFVHIVAPRKTKGMIILRVNIKFEAIKNPTSICKNITPIRTWGKAEMILDSLDKSDEIMAIVKQAFEAAGGVL